MAINKKLIHFNTFENFNSKKLSANAENTQYTLGTEGTVQTGSPDILYQSIVYIKDTKQQWTHGQLYSGGGTSEANVQAVDTSETLEDVTADYATRAYVDGLVGDINSVLESIIGSGATLITFTVNGTEYQAEEGMTFYDWGMSKYYDSSINLLAGDLFAETFNESCQTFGNTSTQCYSKGGISYSPNILLNSVIQPITYTIAEPA